MFDIIPRLRQGEAVADVLPQVPADSAFWKGVRYALDRDPYPHRFTMLNPTQYGPGAPYGVFEKIMDGMISRKLTADQCAVAIGKFSQACTPEEWLNFYRPIIDRNLPLTREDFNLYAPAELRFPALRVYDPPLVERQADLPTSYLMEPIYEGERAIIFLTKKEVRGFYYDGRPFPMEAFEDDFEAIRTHKNVKGEVAFDVIHEDDATLIMRDLIALDQFTERARSLPFVERRKIMEKVFFGLLEPITETLELAECYRVNCYAEALMHFNMLLEQGFHGFYARHLDATYWDERDRKVVPTGETELKLFCLNSGPKGSRYEDVVWSLEGKPPRKKVAHEVVLGLTASQRKEMWQNQHEYAGKKFCVSSCGVLDDDRLMFAKFLNWRD